MNGKTVLVIEDNPVNMKLFRSLLSLEKFEVLEASDAETGLALCRQHRPDLILMDIQLPGMDGYEATRVLKGDPSLAAVPVLALTAHAMAGDEEKAAEAGCDGYITKPIDTRSFRETVVRAIASRSAGTAKTGQGSHRPCVLIVDDDPVNVKLLAAKIPRDLYEIMAAFGGQDALDKVEATPPDIVLLDVMMPGIDGYEVTRSLKRQTKTKDIPIILVTALDGTEDKMRGMEAGADEFLNKPVNTTELLARIKSLLSLKQYKEQLTVRSQAQDLFAVSDKPEDHAQVDASSPSILLVEDNEQDARLIQGFLASDRCSMRWVSEAQKALVLAQGEKTDVILLDLLLPGIDGFEVCRRIKETDATRNIQIIIVTCLQDLDSRIRGIELGADDFLVKPINGEELRVRVKAAWKKKVYLDRLTHGLESALHSAITDRLTGLYNQGYLKHFLEMEVRRAQRQGHVLSLLMIDVEDFKAFNDSMGHLAGDRLLRGMGRLLKKHVRVTDFVARYGGDEFAVVLPYTGQENARAAAERIRQGVNDLWLSDETLRFHGPVTTSMGFASYPNHASSAEELIMNADQALYAAKRLGKGEISAQEGLPADVVPAGQSNQ